MLYIRAAGHLIKQFQRLQNNSIQKKLHRSLTTQANRMESDKYAYLRPMDLEKSKNTLKGGFDRSASQFRQLVTADGSSGFKAEKDRYHIYISLACPWAHRTLLVRNLKGLEDAISVSSVHWYMGPEGWTFTEEYPDKVNHKRTLREVYALSQPGYTGKVTTPVLFDKKTQTVVNNESSEIIRMLNSEFNEFAKNPTLDLYPEKLRASIDEVNSWVYPNINDGVYRCGFATEQQAYETAFNNLFEHLKKADEILGRQRYIAGNQLTEADIRLFTTLIRFDAVYFTHFKCNGKLLIQFENLLDWVREVFQMKGVGDTVDFNYIKHHYYGSHASINPRLIVPLGPFHVTPEFYSLPHNRDKKFSGTSS